MGITPFRRQAGQQIPTLLGQRAGGWLGYRLCHQSGLSGPGKPQFLSDIVGQFRAGPQFSHLDLAPLFDTVLAWGSPNSPAANPVHSAL